MELDVSRGVLISVGEKMSNGEDKHNDMNNNMLKRIYSGSGANGARVRVLRTNWASQNRHSYVE